jgi:hypothetical protein
MYRKISLVFGCLGVLWFVGCVGYDTVAFQATSSPDSVHVIAVQDKMGAFYLTAANAESRRKLYLFVVPAGCVFTFIAGLAEKRHRLTLPSKYFR